MRLAPGVKAWLRTSTMVLALIGIWVAFDVVTGGAFLHARNLSNLFRQMSITGVLAAGMVPVIVAGAIDLSVGSLACFVGALLAILYGNYGLPSGLAFGAALLLAALIGLFQGFLVSFQGIPAFIVTLGGMMAYRGASMWITGGNTIPLPEGWVAGLGSAYMPASMGWALGGIGLALSLAVAVRRKLKGESGWAALVRPTLAAVVVVGFMGVFSRYEGVPVPVVTMLVLALIFDFIMTRSVFGRHVVALGGNPESAYLSGINVKRGVFMVFVLCGVLAGLAGVVLTARVGSASPDAGNLLELDAIAACVIGGTSLRGGKGTVFGALLGALIMESLNNGMSMANMESFWQFIVKGVVLVAAVGADLASQPRAA